MWAIYVHVVPLDDQIDHDHREDCPCGPTPQNVDGDLMFVHHSLDGRELTE